MSVTPDQFKMALGRFCSGVTVITVTDDEGDHAMTASAFTSLSLNPPLVLVCVQKKGNMHERLSRASGFAVNILDQAQESVSNRFAGWWNRGRVQMGRPRPSSERRARTPLIHGGALAHLGATYTSESMVATTPSTSVG